MALECALISSGLDNYSEINQNFPVLEWQRQLGLFKERMYVDYSMDVLSPLVLHEDDEPWLLIALREGSFAANYFSIEN